MKGFFHDLGTAVLDLQLHLLGGQATVFGNYVYTEIKNYPEEWKLEGDGYWLARGNISIWVANAAYGLKVSLRAPSNSVGQPPAPGEDFTPSYADRLLIWSAVRNLNLKTPSEIQQDRADDFARREYRR